MSYDRKGDWLQTFTGRAYWPLDPRPEEVDILDIAHALSNVCRYGGHCSRFYSVAEHSYHVSHIVHPRNALGGLLHDGTEAYLADVVRPLKPYLTNYYDIEENNWRAIAAKFGLPAELAADVKMADNGILFCEHKALFGKPPGPWGVGLEGYAVSRAIHCWDPAKAEEMFLQRYFEVSSKSFRRLAA